MFNIPDCESLKMYWIFSGMDTLAERVNFIEMAM
jgi:hypothetical protein